MAWVLNIILIICLVVVGKNFKFVHVSGYSMYPTYDDGDIRLCRVIRGAEDIDVGDICIYESGGGKLVIHRVVAIDGDMYIFKGDNNLNNDIGPVELDAIKYKVVF